MRLDLGGTGQVAGADFAERITALAREVLSQGPVTAVRCVGVGAGSRRWSEEELRRRELDVVGAFARGCRNAEVDQFCLLSAAGSSARSRVLSLEEADRRRLRFVVFRLPCATLCLKEFAWDLSFDSWTADGRVSGERVS